MRLRLVVSATALVLAVAPPARAGLLTTRIRTRVKFNQLNVKLHGQLLDFTSNHRADRRIDSAALDEKRDLYAYTPPGYDPCQAYPLIIFLHGFGHDENNFLDAVDLFDKAMARGSLPPAVVVAPDGSLRGRPTILNGGSFFVNTPAGRFEDFIMQDVWEFAHRTFSIRPEREAHVLVGASMGGFGAYNLGIKHRDRVGVVAGIFPPLNLRYVDCRGRYFSAFDPSCLGWRTQLQPWHPVARYAGGLIKIRQRRMLHPLFGRDPNAINHIAANNPVEMLDAYNVQPGELEMFIGYVGHDAFNITAQVESFLYFARARGLCISTVYLPEGRHNTESGRDLTPSLLGWLAPRLQPYAPY